MKKNHKHFLRYWLALVLVMSLVTVMGACSSTPTLSSITVTPASPANLVVGSLQQFKANGTYSDGSTTDVSSQVTWASSDTGIATISSAGFATGIAAGKTSIKASMSAVTSPTIALTVVTLSSITVTPASPENILKGSSQQFTATGTYSDGSQANITSEVAWASSSYIATISSAGLAKGVAVGNTNITALMSGITSPAITMVIHPPTLVSIAITPAPPPNITVGISRFFTATGTYSDGSQANITSEVAWANSDTGVATISSSIFTGVAAGSTNITASMSGITSPTVTLTVVVSP
ncbi:MAG: Ig-like domain-containing protein [Chloroflexota bacterium]